MQSVLYIYTCACTSARACVRAYVPHIILIIEKTAEEQTIEGSSTSAVRAAAAAFKREQGYPRAAFRSSVILPRFSAFFSLNSQQADFANLR